MNGKQMFNAIVATMGSVFTYILGVWDTSLIVLTCFITMDYLTGVISAIIMQCLNSHVGFKGLLRKCTIFIVLIVATLLDRLVGKGTWMFRTFTCYFYIANEGISILENCGKCGLKLPQKLVNVLQQLK